VLIWHVYRWWVKASQQPQAHLPDIRPIRGGRKEGGAPLGRPYHQRGVLGIRLILVGREGSHVVERSCFCRFRFNHNDFSILYLYDITELPKTASILASEK